jgi:uncharacterized protein YndB with AHSA1/START domain
MTETVTNDTAISVTRTIAASPERVFDVWIDSKKPGGPWHGERVILNAVVDGLFYMAVKHQGHVWPHYGRFITLDRPRLIEFTWVSEATQGIETVVALEFVSKGSQTEVTLRHSGLRDDEMGRGHKEGWTMILSMLDDAITGKPPAAAGT